MSNDRIRILENAKRYGGTIAMIEAETKILDKRLNRKKGVQK